MSRAVRIGIVNLMPRAETYESTLLGALRATERVFEPIWLRLETAAYASSDRARLERVYLPLSAALESGELDGLIVSGAPVEEMPFEAVSYWPELSELLRLAQTRVASTLGLCWGALALGQLLGLQKFTFSRKLFGVYELVNRAPEHALLRAEEPRFSCPQSRHSGFVPESVLAAEASGRVQVLAESAEAGAVILESADGRHVLHIGHPEYEADRLLFEYRRDHAAGRPDVGRPHNFDLEQPRASWRGASTRFFGNWIDRIVRE